MPFPRPALLLCGGCLLACVPGLPQGQRVGSGGGTVTSDDGVAVTIPAGALDHNIDVTIKPLTTSPSGALLGKELGPTGTVFAQPVTVTFPIDSGTAQTGRLKVMTVVGGTWVALAGRTLTSDSIGGQTTHFSPYALMPSTEDCANGIDDDGDGLIDCADPACAEDTACTPSDGGQPEACHSDSECASGETCSDGNCVADADAGVTCHNDNQCASGEICSSGRCIAAPADAGDIDAGVTCHNDNQCGAHEVCISGSCVEVDGGPTDCASDSDCAAGQSCRGHQCK